jgi:hypothetical protein
MEQEAIQKGKNEWARWRERVRGERNIIQSKEEPENMAKAPAREPAEKELRENQSLNKGKDKEEI